MLFKEGLFLIVFAGIINGCFAVPLRTIRGISHEKIWTYFAIMSMLVLPWILLVLLSPSAFYHYFNIPFTMWSILAIGGIAFGIGQLCQSYAINYIGISRVFATNLGIGMTTGSMFVVFYQHVFFTAKGLLVSIVVVLVVLSLLLNYYSIHKPQQKAMHMVLKKKGWFLAVFAGIGSGLQNISFVIVSFHENALFAVGSSYWYWPPFLMIAGLIMLLGYWLRKRNAQVDGMQADNSHSLSISTNLIAVFALLLLASLFYTGSLALYSISMSQFNPAQRVFGWPALLLSIILSSQLWGVIYKEYHALSRKQRYGIYLGLALLIISILLLSSLST
ncbi:MAG: L-rhamnose/proton symporter RhaT [Pseudomonadota bacterium]